MATPTRPGSPSRGPKPNRPHLPPAPGHQRVRVHGGRPSVPYHLRRGAPGPDGDYLRRPDSPFSIFSGLGAGRRAGRGRRGPDIGLLIVGTLATLCVLWVARAGWNATRVHVQVSGFANHGELTQAEADAVTVAMVFPSADQLRRASLTFDGRDIRDEAEIDVEKKTVSWKPPSLAEGEHALQAKVPRAVLPSAVLTWRFTVDATPPSINIPGYALTDGIDAPAIVSGSVDPRAEVTANGEPVKTHDGRFTLQYDVAPIGPVVVAATDPAGNTTESTVLFRPAYEPGVRGVHGVHVTAVAWGNDQLRQGIVDLIDQGRVDTVELDLKDEGGEIGYDSSLPLAKSIGAVRGYYDLRDAVEYFESRGVHVVGRIVAFRDPILAAAQWASGHHEDVIQDVDGNPFSPQGYGTASFVNYTSERVRQYNLDIAKEAAAAGVDDILWDYIRRPEGAPETMYVEGLTGTTTKTSEAIVDFLREAQTVLRPLGVYEGASVFGISALAPDSIGQRADEMAMYLDYLAPMVYPSHFGPGIFQVADPNAQPYDIVKASLAEFQRIAGDTGIAFVPWLQAFSLYGVRYGPAELDAQIQAAHELGIDDFILWNASVRYEAVAAGLEPNP